MTVQENLEPKKVVVGPFAADDVIPITFEYTNKEDIKVDVNGTLYTYNTDYEVLLQNVIIKTAVESAVPVTVYRDTPLDQQAEFPQNNKFNSAKLNEALDKLCMQQQEQQETIDRSMRVPISVEVENFNPEIPTPVAGRTFRIKDDLSGFEYSQYDPDQAYLDTEEFKNQAGSYATAAQTSATNAASSANIASQKANEAAASATTATEQASIATAKTEEVYITYQEAMAAIAGAKQNSLETISSSTTSGLGSISTATTKGTTSISTATSEALRSVNSAGTSNVSNITNVGQDQLRQLQEETAKAKDYAQKAIGWNITYEPSDTEDTLVFIDRTPEEIEESISYVEEARDQAITAIQATTSGIQGSINTATTNAVNTVNAAGTTAVNNVAATQTSVLSAITSATAQGVNSINATTTDVIASV